MREQKERAMEGEALSNCSDESVNLHASASTGKLDVGFIRTAVRPHHDRHSGHPFATDESDFNLSVARAIGDDRGKPTIGKINVFDPTIADFEVTPKGEIDGFQVGL